MRSSREPTAPRQPLDARRYRRLLLLVSGAAFLDFFDVTVVNVAFPSLRRDFASAGVSDLAWVISGYSVFFAALLTAAGRLADVLGRRRVFLAGVVLFTSASLISAVAPSIGVLIAARCLQGAGAALTLPSGLGIVLAETPPDRRAAALGVWAAASGVAAAFGPSIGGLLVHVTDWRAVFLVNVPTGVLMVAAGRRLIAEIRTGDGRLPDLLGVLTVTAGIGLVVLGVTKGSDWGWSSGATIAALAGGLVLAAVALLRSRHHPAPAVETALWRIRPFARSNLTSIFFGAGVFTQMLIAVLFATGVWHYSVLQAGLAVSPGAITGAVGAAVTGCVVERRGSRVAILTGTLMCVAVDVWLLARLGTDRNFLGVWLPANALGGMGMGIAAVGLSSAAALSVSDHQYAAATGLSMTARQVGGALGIGALAAILEPQLPSPGAGPYLDVFLFCTLVFGAAAFAGSRVKTRPRPAPETAADLPTIAPEAAVGELAGAD